MRHSPCALLNIETAEGFSIGARFLHEYVKTNALVDGVYFDGLFRFGLPEFMNLDAKHRFEEWLGDFLVAKHHRKHELIGDGELLKRCAFGFHFSFYNRYAPVFANREYPYLLLYTLFCDIQHPFFKKFISFYKTKGEESPSAKPVSLCLLPRLRGHPLKPPIPNCLAARDAAPPLMPANTLSLDSPLSYWRRPVSAFHTRTKRMFHLPMQRSARLPL